jgi:Ca2+-dependent lipid-binding protein
VESLNRLLAQAWPLVCEAVQPQVRLQLQPQLDDLVRQYGMGVVASLSLHTLDLGAAPPQLSGLKAYRKSKGDEEVALEAVAKWASQLDVQAAAGLKLPSARQLRSAARALAARLWGGQQQGGGGGGGGGGGSHYTVAVTLDMRQSAEECGHAAPPPAAPGAGGGAASLLHLPLRLANLQLRAHVRITLRPLLEAFPYAGSLSVTLLAPPQADFDLPMAGVDLMSLPLLGGLARRAVRVGACAVAAAGRCP